jgi:Flp pilus assembly protein TadD
MTDSLQALREAARISPDDARFAYVYAVALNGTGQPREAQKVLDSVLKRRPYDRDVLSGLAHFTAQAGNRDAALAYVKQLRELDPENPDYAGLAAQIERTAPR